MKPIDQTIGKNIKRLRQEHDMTQQQLADELFMSHSTISHYESGRRMVHAESLKKIADLFSVSMDELVNGKAFGKAPDKTIRYLITRFDFSVLSEKSDMMVFAGYMIFAVLTYLASLFMPFVILSFVYLIYSTLRFIHNIRRHHVYMPIYEDDDAALISEIENDHLFWVEKGLIVLLMIMAFIIHPVSFDVLFEGGEMTAWFASWFVTLLGFSIYTLISEIHGYRPKKAISMDGKSEYLGLFKYKILHLLYLLPNVFGIMALTYETHQGIAAGLRMWVVMLGTAMSLLSYAIYQYEVRRKDGLMIDHG